MTITFMFTFTMSLFVMNFCVLAMMQLANPQGSPWQRLRRRFSRCEILRRFRGNKFPLQAAMFLWTMCFVPPFNKIFHCLRMSRRFWAAPRGKGFWEKAVCILWKRMGTRFPDWENKQYLLRELSYIKRHVLVLGRTYGIHLARKDTQLRASVPASKRLAVCLHWLAHGTSFTQLATLYTLGKSTIVSIVHEAVESLRIKLVPDAIKFPMGHELEQVMVDFESLCGLPFCGGAIDGTFIPIKKPEHFGDTYYCYKKFCSIICLACVDARGIFTYVNVGRPGSVGDSYTFRNSALYDKIQQGDWLTHTPWIIEGVQVVPYLVADAAFPLSKTCMKCFDTTTSSHGTKYSFNYSLIRTRRVVEQAFGRLKGRWRILSNTPRINDPVFVQKYTMVCCALHNICERHQCDFEPGRLPDENTYTDITPSSQQSTSVSGQASSVRDALATFIHRHRPAP